MIVGFNLRSVILAVPPILPLIQHDLGLSYAATGLLTALPVLALAGVALPSGLLAERIGALLPSRTTFGLTSPVKHISENKPDTAMPTSHTP